MVKDEHHSWKDLYRGGSMSGAVMIW